MLCVTQIMDQLAFLFILPTWPQPVLNEHNNMPLKLLHIHIKTVKLEPRRKVLQPSESSRLPSALLLINHSSWFLIKIWNGAGAQRWPARLCFCGLMLLNESSRSQIKPSAGTSRYEGDGCVCERECVRRLIGANWLLVTGTGQQYKPLFPVSVCFGRFLSPTSLSVRLSPPRL